MPPLESMACGAPAIVCRNSSLPEVVGDAAVFVDEDDPSEMTQAIIRLFDANHRDDIVARGLERTRQFTFSRMAKEFSDALVETHEKLKLGEIARPSASWSELRGFQQGCQARGLKVVMIERTQSAERDQGVAVAPVADFSVCTDLDEARRVIAAMKADPFWRARQMVIRALKWAGFRRATKAGFGEVR
jgi:hypothetical protein